MICYGHWRGISPAVGDATAVPAHAQALLQVRCEAGSGDAAAAVGTNTLLVLPLVVHLAKDVHPWLVHDFYGKKRKTPTRVFLNLVHFH